MDEALFSDNSGQGGGGSKASRPNAISFGSQMLAVGAGFCVFIMLLALFAAVQHRKRRRSSAASSTFRSPLIHKHSFGGHSTRSRLSQAIPPPPAPQYLRCSNQSLRKCSSPGGSDYSLSSSYSSSAGSAHSLSPMSPYATHHPPSMNGYQQSPFAGLNFIPYGGVPPPKLTTTTVTAANNTKNSSANEQQKRRHSNAAAAAEVTLLGTAGGGTPELVVDAAGRGSVSFQLAYDQANLALQVTVLACNGLPKFAGNVTPLNPYIKLRLLPEGQHRVKTRILRDTRDPVFDEAFTMYGLSVDTIRAGTLHLSAFAFDRYNGDTVLGEAVYNLADFHPNIEPQSVSLKWQSRCPFDAQKRGKALVGLKFNAKTRGIKFSLLKINELPEDATLGLLDPYAKVYALINGQKRIAKQKTRVMRRTLNPEFGPEDWLEFTLPDVVGVDQQHSLSFHVVLFNHDGVKRNEPIGQFTVDAESELFSAAFQQHDGGIRRGAAAEADPEWHTILPI